MKKFVDDKKTKFEDGYQVWTKSYDGAFANWSKSIADLEKLYEEKLRLDGPAKYWERLAKSYVFKGRIWVGMSAVTIAVLMIVVGIVLYKPPAILNAGQVTLGGLKRAVTLAVGLSAVIYFVHLCVRLAVSAHHLSRDGKEREQLTHMYLALIKEKAIEPKEREIVLQALFSRADTGLLKTEGGPTMPAISTLAAIAKK